MASTDVFSLRNSGLSGFLFADVGTEASGMQLSVLSTLARVGMDPWQEAARLASLPRADAIAGLARIISAMPASLWPPAVATPIAERLVALLPSPRVGAPAGKRVMTPEVSRWALMLALLASMLIGMTFGPSVRHAAPVGSDAAPAASISHAAQPALKASADLPGAPRATTLR